MADITQLPDYKFVQISTPTQGDLTLSQSISSSDTSLIVSYEPKNEDGTSITKDFFIQLTSTVSGKRYTETMLCTAVSGTTLTVVRGIDRGGLDYAGSASNAISHQAGTVIKANLPAGLFQAHDSALKGEIGTGGSHIKIGTGADVNSGIKAFNADANKPFIEYDAATNAWIASNDGTSSFAIGTGAGAITGGDGITVTAGDIDVDRTDTTTFKAVSAGVADAGKAVLFDSDGYVDSDSVQVLKDITATSTEINQALDGISANVTAANLNTLTASTSSNADALHTHGLGVKNLTGSFSNSTQNASGTGVITIALGSANAKRIRIFYTLACGNNYPANNTANWVKESGILESDFTNYSIVYSSSTYTGLQQVYAALNFFDTFPNTSKSTLPSLTGDSSAAVAITGISKSGSDLLISYSYNTANVTGANNFTTIEIRGTAY